MKIMLDKRFKKNLSGKFGKYDLQIGVLKDSTHMEARRGKRGLKGKDVLSTYAGGPVRKKSSSNSGMTVAGVLKENSMRVGFNILSKPFEKKNSDIMKFTKEFFKMAFGKTEKKRLENLLQAIVRNPILRGDYGSNSALTQKIKGFNRGMIDTGQMFKSITALCRVRR